MQGPADTLASCRIPRNRGTSISQKPPLRLGDNCAIRITLKVAQRPRDLALFNLGLDIKLRGCDLVRLRVVDVVVGRTVGPGEGPGWPRFPVPQPGHPWKAHENTTIAPCLGSWVRAAGLDPTAYGTHSLRRTIPSMIYRGTGNLRAVQLLLSHTKLESTVRYLGIEVEDALTISEQVEI